MKVNLYQAIKIVQNQLSDAREGVREQLYGSTAVALEFAYVLEESDEAWEKCCNDPIWGNQKPDRKNVLLAAFKYVERAFSGLRFEQTRFHAKAMQPAFRDRKRPEDVKKYIKDNGGFRKLHDAELARERADNDNVDDSDRVDKQDEITVSKTGIVTDRYEDPDQPAAGQSDEAHRPSPKKRYAQPLKGRVPVEVILLEKDGYAVTNKDWTSEFVIRCRQVPNGDCEWVRIEGIVE